MERDYLISIDEKRALVSAPFGIAAYEGNVDGGEWAGRHVGVFDHEADALAWLATGEPQPIKVYAAEQAAS